MPRWLLLGAVFAVPLIPCVVSGGFAYPFVSPKGHLFRLLVDVAAGSWAVLAATKVSVRPRWSPLLGAAVVLVAVVGVADALGVCPSRSLLGNLERMEGWLTWLHLLAFFLVLPAALSSARLWWRFFALSVTASVAVSAVAVAQLAGFVPILSPGGRVGGTLGNSSFLAAYLAFHIWLVTYHLLCGPTTRRLRILAGGVIALEAVVVVATTTRSVMLAVVACGVTAVGLAWHARRGRPGLRLLVAGMVAGTLLVGLGLVVLGLRPLAGVGPSVERLAAVSPFDDLTAHGRLLTWRTAVEGAAERPWLGWGQESFSVVYARYYDPRLYTHDPFFDRAHNVFLDLLIVGGVAALSAYCALIASFLVMVWRPPTFSVREISLLTGLAAGYLVHTALMFDTLTSLILCATMGAYVHWRSTASRPGIGRGGPPVAWGSAACMVFALAVLAAGLTVRTIVAERALMTAIRPHPQGLAGNLAAFQRALRHHTPATAKVRERLLTTAVRMRRAQPQDRDMFARLTSLATEEMRRQIEAWPLDVRSHVALGSALWRLGALDEAERVLGRAHELAPRMQHIQFELGAAQLARHRPDLAFETLRAAYQLAPNWTTARNRFAAAAIAAGRRDVAEGLLLPAEGTVAVADDWIIQALRATGDLPTLAEALEKRIAVARSTGEDAAGLQQQLDSARRALRRRATGHPGEGGSHCDDPSYDAYD